MQGCQGEQGPTTTYAKRSGRLLLAGLMAAALLPAGSARAADVPSPVALQPDYAFPERLLLPWPCGAGTLQLIADWRSHTGVGFGLDFGRAATPGPVDVLAPAAGTVVERGWSDEGYGWHVEIDAGHGWHVLVGHLAASYEGGVGDGIAAGQVLGTMGNSGLAEEPHIHFELIPADGRAPDPDRIELMFGRGRDEFAFRGGPHAIPHPCPSRAGRAVESSEPTTLG